MTDKQDQTTTQESLNQPSNTKAVESTQTLSAKQQTAPNYQSGELYRCIDGKMVQIERDPDDNQHKVRLANDAYDGLLLIQKRLRKALNGYRPDITLVASALMKFATDNEEEAINAVKAYALQVFAETNTSTTTRNPSSN